MLHCSRDLHPQQEIAVKMKVKKNLVGEKLIEIDHVWPHLIWQPRYAPHAKHRKRIHHSACSPTVRLFWTKCI